MNYFSFESAKPSSNWKNNNNNIASPNYLTSPNLKKISTSPSAPPGTRVPTNVMNTSSPASPAVSQKQEDECKTKFNTRNYVISLFASNFYRFKISALILAFVINFLLLFSKVLCFVITFFINNNFSLL